MSGGWNAMPLEREAARALWTQGKTRREIAAALNVSENTVSKWRWLDGWPNRRRYEDRPIVNHRHQTHRGPAHERTGKRKYQARTAERKDAPQPQPTLYRCPFCPGASSDPAGHSACIVRNTKVA